MLPYQDPAAPCVQLRACLLFLNENYSHIRIEAFGTGQTPFRNFYLLRTS
ncbi:hypothetical protein HMPREF0004_4039 [Achromobacter piechaudii ATCC 43553]|uniref:Uncharacterized protein n=1 Tax=Achromobacter piechaudii ATCC 43553 TaxID=742159 RepID=D4XEZ2_9BURK|nr:hypothetical protein HMPREF0004_4039 [Achromobacter piechaudii ATCC 43553]